MSDPSATTSLCLEAFAAAIRRREISSVEATRAWHEREPAGLE